MLDRALHGPVPVIVLSAESLNGGANGPGSNPAAANNKQTKWEPQRALCEIEDMSPVGQEAFQRAQEESKLRTAEEPTKSEYTAALLDLRLVVPTLAKKEKKFGNIVDIPQHRRLTDEQMVDAKWALKEKYIAFGVSKHEHEAAKTVESAKEVLVAYDERPDGKMDIGEFRKLAQDMEARLATKPETGLIISDLGLASLVPEWRRMFDKSTVVTDVTAGVTVGCVAVPLSLAIALASGVPPEVGLASAAVAGVVGGLMGGTTLAITGPAAAISLLVCEAVQTHGLGTLPFITLACGGLQLATGVVRGGGVAKYVPESVIAGFTTGIGVMILAGQLPKALDLTVPAGLNTVEVVSAVVSGLGSASPAACALALGVVATMQLSPLIHPKIPSALVAVSGATAVTQFGGLSATTIGALPSGLDAFTLCMPVVPSLEALPSLGGTIMIIYALTSAESLLSCTALDKLRPTSYKHNPDQELIGQGLANMTSAAFAGMPVTAVIARSSLNIKLKAHSRLPALVQSAFVFGSLALYSDVISTVPVSALAGAPPSRAHAHPTTHTPPFPPADHSHPANPYPQACSSRRAPRCSSPTSSRAASPRTSTTSRRTSSPPAGC